MITVHKLTRSGELCFTDQPDLTALSAATEEMLWIDLENPTQEEAAILSDVFHFHPLAIEDCLGEVQYPKLDIYENCIFLVLHGINWQTKTEQFATAQVGIFLGRNFLVTHHQHKMRSVLMAMDRCKSDKHPFVSGMDFLLYLILDRMVDHYFPELEELEDKLESLENEVLANPDEKTLQKIFQIKRETLHLKRIVFPQREVFNRLSRDEIAYIKPATRLYFRDIYDNLFRMADIADSYRDLISSTLEAYLSSVSNRLNQIMKVLTVFSVVALPLAIGTGIFGMSFEHLPGRTYPHAFAVSMVCMVLVSLVMLLYFRIKKWF
jgi:magnesium transporter